MLLKEILIVIVIPTLVLALPLFLIKLLLVLCDLLGVKE